MQRVSEMQICFSYFKTSILKYFYSTAQKTKFFIKDSFSRCDQNHRKLRIWSHFLKKSWIKNFIYCAVLSTNSTEWSNTAKQLVGCCWQIVWVSLTIFGGCRWGYYQVKDTFRVLSKIIHYRRLPESQTHLCQRRI